MKQFLLFGILTIIFAASAKPVSHVEKESYRVNNFASTTAIPDNQHHENEILPAHEKKIVHHNLNNIDDVSDEYDSDDYDYDFGDISEELDHSSILLNNKIYEKNGIVMLNTINLVNVNVHAEK